MTPPEFDGDGLARTTDTPEQQRASRFFFEEEWPALRDRLRELDRRRELTTFVVLLLLLDLSAEDRTAVVNMLVTGEYPFRDDKQTSPPH